MLGAVLLPPNAAADDCSDPGTLMQVRVQDSKELDDLLNDLETIR